MGLFARPIQVPIVMSPLAVIVMHYFRCWVKNNPVTCSPHPKTKVILKSHGIAGETFIKPAQLNEKILATRHICARGCHHIRMRVVIPSRVGPSPNRVQ